MNGEGLSNISFLMAFAYKKIKSLKLEVIIKKNTLELEKAMITRYKRWPNYTCEPYKPIWNYYEETNYVSWKRPYFFKNVSDIKMSGGTLEHIRQLRSMTLVNREYLIEEQTGVEVKKVSISEVEKQFGFDTQFKKLSPQIENTYANYLALQKRCIYPASYLSDCDIEYLGNKNYLDRNALFIKAYPRNPFIYEMSGKEFHIVGDYEQVLIDKEFGFVLHEKMFLEKAKISSLEISKIEANEDISDDEFRVDI